MNVGIYWWMKKAGPSRLDYSASRNSFPDCNPQLKSGGGVSTKWNIPFYLFIYLFCVGVCVWGGVCGCVCLAYTSEDFHMKTHRYTEDSTPSEDPKTGPRKTLAKNAKNVMFYHLRGVRAPRTSTDFQPYLIYEDIRVLGSISKASGCVCVCVCAVISMLIL